MGLSGLDRRLLLAFRTRGHTPALDIAMIRFSAVGEHGILWLAIGATGWIAGPPRRRGWARGICAVASAYVANTAIKVAVRRRRPSLPGLPPMAKTPTRLSFPSAHTATAWAGTLAYSRVGAPSAPLLALAAATSLSRLYLGLHYPSDVVAGAALGAAVAAAVAPRASASSCQERSR